MTPHRRLAPPVSLSLALVVFLLPLAAQEDGSKKKEKEDAPAGPLDGPRRALRTGDVDAAVEGFRKATEVGGETPLEASVAARRGWAAALAAGGKYDEALKVLAADAAASSRLELINEASSIHLRMGKLEHARTALENASEPEKAHVSAQVERLWLLGRAAEGLGRLDEARASFEKAIEVYKELESDAAEKLAAETFVHWGLALIGLNRYGEANRIMFSQAVELDAKSPLLLLEQGRALHAKYNFPESRDCYKDAIEQNPRFAEAHAALAANLLIDYGAGPNRFEKAEKHVEEALKANPRCAEAYLERGNIWLHDGNYGKAVEDLERAIRENPAALKARGLKAACHFLLAEPEKFAAEEKAALAANPKGAEFFHTVSIALEQRFRYFDTVAMCDRALGLDADYWPAFVTLGINCLRTGENGRGRKFIEKSWEKDKFNVWVNNTRILIQHMDDHYTSSEDGDFVFYFPKEDAQILNAFLVPLLKKAKVQLEARYRTALPRPIQVEDFSKHQWFSARTVGLPGFAASGACFGRLVTLTTPKALPQNWGAVAWHEFAHVAALALTEHHVPRWLTEGLSVYEEGLEHPHWARNFQRELADAWASRRLLPLAELDYGFSKPKYPMQILISYFQGCQIVRLIVERWSFDKILEILRGYRENKNVREIFKEALGMGLDEFDREFDAYMRKWVEANGYRPRLEKEMIPILEAAAEKAVEKAAEKAADKDPKDAKAQADLAWAYLCDGNAVDASIAAARALEADPKCGDAHAVGALMKLREKRIEAAAAAFEKALEAGTAFTAECHARLGAIRAKEKGMQAKAIEHLEAAKKLSPVAVAGFPASGNVYYQLAKLYEETGDEERANQQMVELARFAVEDGECRVRIARYALEKKKDPKLAVKYLDELMYINPFDAKFHKLLGRAAADAGDHDLVIREYNLLLGFPDTNPRQARLALAKAHLAKGDKAKAALEAERLLKLDPEHEEAKEILEKAK